MYVPLDSPKYNEMRKKLIHIIEMSVHKYHLAMYLQPHLKDINDSALYELHACLDDVHNHPGKYSVAVCEVLDHCQHNEQLLQVIQEMIKKYYSRFTFDVSSPSP
jgi:hypothetical protein